MKLVVGLGNPGRRYATTRHNVGFRIVDRLAERCGIRLDQHRFDGRFGEGRLRGLDLALLEPQTFMNASGEAVAQAVRELGLADPARELVVVYDDVDLPFGRLRIRPSGGAGGHRGLSDVIELLARKDFPRLRFGVGRSGEEMATSDWVLQPFSREEQRSLPRHLERACDALESLLLEGAEVAMNRFNAASDGEA